jgi:hypothetical protein
MKKVKFVFRPVLETYSEMEAFFSKTLPKENAAMKAKLYVSVWARLGFTVSHLVHIIYLAAILS